MSFSLNLFQQNIQHSQLGSSCVLNRTKDLSSFLYLIQEPYNYKEKTRLLDNQHSILGSSHPDNRAIIYGHQNLHLWPDSRFCSRDVSACLWKTGSSKLGEIVLLSVYWAKDQDSLPFELLEAVHFCNKNGVPYLISIDANAHNPLWNDKDLDDRGILIESFLDSNPVTLLNKGDVATFHNTRGHSTFIDLTIINRAYSRRHITVLP